MKRYYLTFILMALTLMVQAQNTGPRVMRGSERNAAQQKAAETSTELTVRAQIMNEQLTQEVGNARWIRNIIRELDLTKEKNAPLYYPVQEMNGMKNLFSSMFQLLSEDKIKVYAYLPDYESFDDENILPFKEMLDRFKIFYETVPATAGRPAHYIVNSSDIPSREVKKMYVKEAWYFDQNNSVFDVKTLAICPIAYFILDTSEEFPEPMFWVKYEDISPYIKNNYIMTSNLNNAKTYTMDDFFRRRMYDGEIIQTENLMNMPLLKLYETDEELAKAQQQVENELVTFEKALWLPLDSIHAAAGAKDKKATARSDKKTSVKPEKVPKQPKSSTPKAERASSSSSSSSSRSSGGARTIRR
jgi:gliding motility associated protien GldN